MVKVSMAIFVVLFVLSGGYSIAIFIVPTIVLEGDFQAMTEKSYEELLDPEAVEVALVHIRFMAMFAIATAASSMFILFAGFRKVEKWAWWAMSIVGTVIWGYGTVVNFAITNTFDFIVFLVGFVASLIALFLPIKRFFPKTT